MRAALGALIDFNLSSEPQLELAHWLVGQGVDLDHVLNVVGPIVEHDIIVFPGKTFDFAQPGDPEARRAVVQVALDEDAKTPTDLIAWLREEPGAVFRCLGFAAAVGIDQLLNPASYFANRPLLVHRSPLAWLAAGCVGIVPLDYDALRQRLSWLPAGCCFAAENLAHGQALREQLKPMPDYVQIVIPRTEIQC